MIRKLVCCFCLAWLLTPPALGGPLPRVGTVFEISSPEFFSPQTLGASKAEIEAEISTLLAERLEFYFPFFDWTNNAQIPTKLVFKLVDQPHGTCEWQSALVVRAMKAGVETEMIDIPDIPLYDDCDWDIPNRADSAQQTLIAEDRDALLSRIKWAIENSDASSEQFSGILKDSAIRKTVHEKFLGTIPIASALDLRAQPDGSGNLLFLPVNFDELKSSIGDLSCDSDDDNCSRLRLIVNLPDSQTAQFSLRIAGSCGDQVLCEVLGGGVPGGYNLPDRTWWDDDFGALLSQAQSMSITMQNFTKIPYPCVTDTDTGLLLEP